MSCKSPKPLNGNAIDPGTNARSANTAPGPTGKDQGDSPCDLKLAKKRVKTAVHGLVFNLVPTDSGAQKWSDTVLAQTLLKDDIFEDLMKRYLELVVSGNIEVGSSGEVKSSWEKLTPEKIILGTAGPVFEKRLKQDPHVARLITELEALGKLYGAEIKQVFVDREWTKMLIVVATGVAAGAVVVGLVDQAQERKSDTLASVATGLAGIIPKTLYEVGSLKVGHTGIEWTPSDGKWKSSAFVSGQWQVHSNLKLNGRVEVLGSEKGARGKAKAGATLVLGKSYLDSIEGNATGYTDGNYELMLQLNKTIKGDGGTRLEGFIGAKYVGRYDGEPNSKGGPAVIGGLKLRFGGKK